MGGNTQIADRGVLARVRRRLHRLNDRTREKSEQVMSALGVHHSEERLIADAANYWADRSDPRWLDDSHWCGGRLIDEGRFDQIGTDHLALFDQLAAMVGGRPQLGRVLEWGVGGGANAVRFAPRADSFVALDINPHSTTEAARVVKDHCHTPVTEVVVDVAAPDVVLDEVPAGSVDLFLCLYVLELVPSPEYGLRLMRLAAAMLRSGALAFVQIKYSTGATDTWSPRRNYRFHNANMTTYRLDHFWTAMDDMGLRPVGMTLVPESALDQHYGYVLMRRT
ncbi:class I SAM-dependent methyltransferase [Actinomycetospora callitridis]|uniref:class I SAM-dependent methyltransferase n=1 Tax=Actinomycetospora callitridis TaxID=913944 RepID=UPI002365CC49|nr:methyltransferase domain-containing protein [Actinomycetospora callitridis]MDD7917658.1 methyltransferase domain-containing protein [Actinomycetospora callitridis]